MLGHVVKLQTLGYAAGLSRREMSRRETPIRGVQVVEYQPDHRDVGVGIVHQPLHLMGEVLHGALLGNGHVAHPLGSQVRNRLRVPSLRYS